MSLPDVGPTAKTGTDGETANGTPCVDCKYERATKPRYLRGVLQGHLCDMCAEVRLSILIDGLEPVRKRSVCARKDDT